MARQWSARCYGVARQREGSRQNSIGAPACSLARDVRDGQAVVCPLLRGSSATRGVAPKQHRGSGVLSLRHFSGWFSLSLGAWVPKNLAGAMLLDRLGPAGFRFMVSAGAMLLDRLGPAGFRFMGSAGALLLARLGPAGFRFTDFRAPRYPGLSALRARGR